MAENTALGMYVPDTSWTNDNAGNCMWCFAKKDGKDYFIKQFLEVKYPENDTESSPERIEKKRKECEDYEKRKKYIYENLNKSSDGVIVRVEEFFRVETKYYISMRKIPSLKLQIADIARMRREEVQNLCAVIAHGVAALHRAKIVHSDLKHENILFMKSAAGEITAKLIDFDSAFPESNPPKTGEEIGGDQVYFSPEAYLRMWEEKGPPLTCKMDVFALGVLFHQYFTGYPPAFDRGKSAYVGEAAAQREPVSAYPSLPEDIRELLNAMLSPEPDKRPTAEEVFRRLANASAQIPESPEETDGPWMTPGDL